MSKTLKTYSADDLKRYIPKQYRSMVKEVKYHGEVLDTHFRTGRLYTLVLSDEYRFVDRPVNVSTAGEYSFPKNPERREVTFYALSQLKYLLRSCETERIA